MPGFNPNAPLFLPSPASSSIELHVSGENLTPDSLVHHVNEAISSHLAALNPSLTLLLQIRPDPHSSDLIAVFLASSYVVASRAVALFNSNPCPLPWSVDALLVPHNIEPPVPFYYPYAYPYPFFYPASDPSIKPVPSFITNLVAGNKPGSLITITDEEGAEIHVNPCRLFVGNIPFLSTWPALKNFLVASVLAAEPHASLDILRVEIPMQTSSTDDMPLRGSSRGFAIVTTGNQETSELLIELTNGAVFEGRSLTVRYDRFPDYNNYVVQHLLPNKHHRSPGTLGTLGYERNALQHRLYYGSQNIPYGIPHHTRSSGQSSTQLSTLDPAAPPPKLKHKPSVAANSPKKPTRNHQKSSKPRARAPHDDIGEEQRARELVDSFRSLGLH